MGMTVYIDIAGLLFILLFCVQLITVVRIYRGNIFNGIYTMTSISLRGGKSFLLFGGAFSLFAVMFGHAISLWVPPFPPVLMTGLGLVAIGGACLPPGVVYLGASEPPGVSFVHKLMFAIAPMKVTHLLNTFKSDPMLGDQVHMSEYRVTKEWQEAIRRLCGIAPLIILDLRIFTSFVLEEVHLILSCDQRHRTIFLTEDDGQAPILDSLETFQDGFFLTLTPKAAIESLHGIGWRSLSRGMEAINDVIGAKTLLQ